MLSSQQSSAVNLSIKLSRIGTNDMHICGCPINVWHPPAYVEPERPSFLRPNGHDITDIRMGTEYYPMRESVYPARTYWPRSLFTIHGVS
jgi:hypothetical protein